MTKINSAPSLVPDPTVALIAQDDLHLWRQTPRAWISSSPCSRVRASHRTCAPRFSAAAAADYPPATRAQRARRQLCLLLSLAIACRAPRHCCPLTAVLSPPPPKYSGNEEGAKMTGSIFDFASRTCASATVPRELALGAGSSGMIRVSTATSSSAASAEGIGRGKRALAARSEGAKLTISIFVVASRERLAKRYYTFAAALAAATHAHARSDCFSLSGLSSGWLHA